MSSKIICPECDKSFSNQTGRSGGVVCPHCDHDFVIKGKKKKKKKAEEKSSSVTKALVMGGFLVAFIALAGLMAALRGGPNNRKAPDDSQEASSASTSRPDHEPAPYKFDPVPWAVPDGSGSEKKPLPAKVEYPFAREIRVLSGTEYLAYDVNHVPRRGQFDPATGTPIDKGLAITGFKHLPIPLSPAVVSPSGILAFPEKSLQTVLLFPPGASDPKTIDGLGYNVFDFCEWTKDNKLVVNNKGKFTCWDVESGTKVWEDPTPRPLPAAMAPGRNWLVATNDGKWIEILSVTDGTCLARFEGYGKWRQFAVSHDGTRLGCLRYAGPNEHDGGWPGNMIYDLFFWDLKEGRRIGKIEKYQDGIGGVLMMLSSKQAMFTRSRKLVDIDNKVFAGNYVFPNKANPSVIYQNVGDDRVWYHSQETDRDYLLAPDASESDPTIVFKPGVGVRIEADMGDDTKNRTATDALAGVVRKAGYPDGGEWVLRIVGAAYDTDKTMTMTGSIKTVPIPSVKCEVRLIAPDGTVVASAKHERGFPGAGSKYFKKSTLAGGPGLNSVQSYDFGQLDPREAMLAEAWEKFFESLPTVQWPRAARKVDGKYSPP